MRNFMDNFFPDKFCPVSGFALECPVYKFYLFLYSFHFLFCLTLQLRDHSSEKDFQACFNKIEHYINFFVQRLILHQLAPFIIGNVYKLVH